MYVTWAMHSNMLGADAMHTELLANANSLLRHPSLFHVTAVSGSLTKRKPVLSLLFCSISQWLTWILWVGCKKTDNDGMAETLIRSVTNWFLFFTVGLTRCR